MLFTLFFLFSGFVNAKEIQLQLNWKPEPQFGGFFDPAFSKELNKSGLQVKIIPGGSGTPTVQMLASKATSYAIVSAEEILISNSKNPKNPLIALFAVYQRSPQILMCHEEARLKNLNEVFKSDLMISMQSGLTYAQYLIHKLNPQKKNIVPYQGGIQIFLQDKKLCQQGFVNSEPLLAKKAGARIQVYEVADYGFNPYTTVLATRLESYQKNKPEAEALIKSSRLAWMSYLKKPELANKVMTELNPAMDLNAMNEAAKAQMLLIRPDPSFSVGSMIKERWEILSKQLAELKIIDKPISVEEIIPR